MVTDKFSRVRFAVVAGCGGLISCCFFFFFFNDTATTEIYTLSLHDALPIFSCATTCTGRTPAGTSPRTRRSEEHTSELQSQSNLVCRLLLEKKKKKITTNILIKAKKKVTITNIK